MPILDQMVLEQNTEVEVFIYFVIYLATPHSRQRSKKSLDLLMVPSYDGVYPSGHPLDPIKNDSPTWQGDQ